MAGGKATKYWAAISPTYCTPQCDEAEWYGDGYNIRGRMIHHDGTNYVLYRIAKDRDEAERIAAKIYSGEIDEEGFRRRTRSLYPYVADVYGWKTRNRNKVSRENDKHGNECRSRLWDVFAAYSFHSA